MVYIKLIAAAQGLKLIAWLLLFNYLRELIDSNHIPDTGMVYNNKYLFLRCFIKV